MESLGWRRRRGSSPAARRGARKRAGLTPVFASNTLSCEGDASPKTRSKNSLTVITVSTATISASEFLRRKLTTAPHFARRKNLL